MTHQLTLQHIFTDVTNALKDVEITMKVGLHFEKRKFQPEDITGYSRIRPLVTIRHIFCFIAYGYGYPLTEIGRFLGRDHTTIIHALHCVEAHIKTGDSIFSTYVDLLRHNAPNLVTSLYEPRKRYSGDGCIISRFEIVKCV